MDCMPRITSILHEWHAPDQQPSLKDVLTIHKGPGPEQPHAHRKAAQVPMEVKDKVVAGMPEPRDICEETGQTFMRPSGIKSTDIVDPGIVIENVCVFTFDRNVDFCFRPHRMERGEDRGGQDHVPQGAQPDEQDFPGTGLRGHMMGSGRRHGCL